MAHKFKTPEDAAFKLRVYFRDGNAGSFYSRDWRGERFEPHIGLLHLQRYVNRKREHIQSALIYEKRTLPDTLLQRFADGQWTNYHTPSFTQTTPS